MGSQDDDSVSCIHSAASDYADSMERGESKGASKMAAKAIIMSPLQTPDSDRDSFISAQSAATPQRPSSPQYTHDAVEEESMPKRRKTDPEIQMINEDLEAAKETMRENVEKTINRGGNFEELADRAHDLENQTNAFLVKSETTRKTTRWLRYRSYIFLAMILMILCAIISFLLLLR